MENMVLKSNWEEETYIYTLMSYELETYCFSQLCFKRHLLYFKYGHSCNLLSLNNEMLTGVPLAKVPLEFSLRHATLALFSTSSMAILNLL